MEASETEKSTNVKISKRRAIEASLAQQRPAVITQQHWTSLKEQHAPISESYLRSLLRDSGVPLDPLVDGVHQDSFEALEKTLTVLGTIYETAKSAGDRETASASRKVVISAKDHARWAADRAQDEQKKSDKAEMLQWLLVWLENPPVFAEWVKLRRAAMAAATEVLPTQPE